MVTKRETAPKKNEDAAGRGLVVAVVLCLIVLACLGVVIAGLIFKVGPLASLGESPSATSSQTAQLSASDQEQNASANTTATTAKTSGKLAGATETTDANGIVHGTTADGIGYLLWGRGTAGQQTDKVTLAACGDQLGTTSDFPIAAEYGQRSGTDYDFTPFYQEVAPFIQQYDLRFINQETVMAGGELSGYPVFNSPSACAEAINNVGFNLVNFCSNHLYDRGTAGIENSLEIFAQYPQMLVSGSYSSAEDRSQVRMIERNGITFALLSYTCVDNWYNSSDAAPNDYNLAYAEKDRMETEIRRAQQVADVTIVYMHWGTEYTYEINDQQWDYAQFLADLDVDLVLGSHNHNVQPTKYITGASGHVTPVVFGLSDFVSGWTLGNTIFSGIFTCDFARQADGSVTIQNLLWWPTIEWSDGGDVYVRRFCDMDQETVDASTRIIDIPESYYENLREALESCGMEIPIKWEK